MMLFIDFLCASVVFWVGLGMGIYLVSKRQIDYKARWLEANRLLQGANSLDRTLVPEGQGASSKARDAEWQLEMLYERQSGGNLYAVFYAVRGNERVKLDSLLDPLDYPELMRRMTVETKKAVALMNENRVKVG